MNVLDRLDQLERSFGTEPPLFTVRVPRAHLRTLLDVARAAQRIQHHAYDVQRDADVELREVKELAGAALAPLLEEQ